MEGEMQPADEGPCAPNTCRQKRGPYGTMKTFQSKRSGDASRLDVFAAVEAPPFGDGHRFTFHPEQAHRIQLHCLQQLHQSAISSSSQHHHHHPTPQHQQQLQQHRLPCENRPSSRVPTSTSATAPPGTQQRRAGSGRAESRFSPDCTYGISSENRLILDAFAQQCSRVLHLLNDGRLLEPSSAFASNVKLEDGPAEVQGLRRSSLVGESKPEESSSTTTTTTDPAEEEEAERSPLSRRQTSAILRVFTDSLQNYLLTGLQQQQQHLAARLEEEQQCPSAEPRSGDSPARRGDLGRWGSPTPSESYGHPSSTLPEEEDEEEEEERCCPRCLELEQEVLSLQQENEELRNKLENIPVPCQNALDYFKTVLEFHNQLVQPMAEEQLAEWCESVDSKKTLLLQEEERQTVFEGSKQLLENYPLFISNKQWDEAVNSSKRDGRRLLRYLIRYVFTTDELKFSCGLGKRKRSAHAGDPGLERRPLNPVKVSCLREFIRMHCASNPDWWMPSEEQINKVFSDAVGHARQGRAVATFLGGGGGLFMDGFDGHLSQDELYLKSCQNGQFD